MRRFVNSIGALLLAAAGVLALVPAAQAAEGLADVETTRYGGADRYATSLLIAEAVAAEAGGTLGAVVMVSGRSWTDAVVAAPLAGSLGAAVLATPPGQLRSDAAEFLRRTKVSTAWLIGANSDTGGVGPSVVAGLESLGISTRRISDTDQYATAAAVARQIGTPGDMGSLGATAVVASGKVFADALVAGAFAARGRHPVLLTPPGELHDDAATYLRDLQVEHVVLMGGTAALSAEVEASISELGIRVKRLAGKTRYDTAVKAAELTAGRYESDCFINGRVGVARARVPFDSFSAGPLLGRLCAPLLLADPSAIPADTAAYLDKVRRAANAGNDAIDLRVFGGDAAVSRAAIDEYLAVAEPEPTPDGVTCDIELGDRPVALLGGDAARRPAWSPDCNRIAFVDGEYIWTARTDGTDRVRLARGVEPSWSPDGARVAFVRFSGQLYNDDHPMNHIFVIDADGTGEKRLTSGNVSDRWPSWSPDGERIAFSRHNLESPDTFYDQQDVFVVVMSTNGRNLTPLTRGGTRDDHPVWSPDGQQIAYNSDGRLWVIRADGTAPRQITDTPWGRDRPAWSPAGDALAFTTLEFLANDRVRHSLKRYSLVGTGTRTITSYSGPNDEHLVIRAPHWSPDGRSILFERAKNTGAKAQAFAAAVPR